MEVRKDCRVVGEVFILEPVVDFESVQQVLDSIPVTFGSDQNFTTTLDWGKTRGLITSLPDDSGQNDMASSWSHDKLEVAREWFIIAYIGNLRPPPHPVGNILFLSPPPGSSPVRDRSLRFHLRQGIRKLNWRGTGCSCLGPQVDVFSKGLGHQAVQ